MEVIGVLGWVVALAFLILMFLAQMRLFKISETLEEIRNEMRPKNTQTPTAPVVIEKESKKSPSPVRPSFVLIGVIVGSLFILALVLKALNP